MKKKINLFIVGAMKAGTTSFNQMLSDHPEIYFSPIKEPNYFVKELPKSIYEPSRFFNINNYFNNIFPKELHIANVKKQEDYNKLFLLSTDKHKYCAEGSTSYLHAKESAELIYKYNPEAKIIILLRNPLKRAFSHYKMDLGLGRTNKIFQDLISNDIDSLSKNQLSNWSYLGMSLYYQNIKRYKDLFGKRVLILHFEDLIKNKSEFLNEVFSFLEISNVDLIIPHANPSKSVHFQKILYFFKQIGFKDFFSFLVPKFIKHAIFRLISKKNVEQIQLDDSTKQKLNILFKEDNSKYTKYNND